MLIIFLQVRALYLLVMTDSNHLLYLQYLLRLETIWAMCQSAETMAQYPNDQHWLVLGDEQASFMKWLIWQTTPGTHVEAVKSKYYKLTCF